jgi:hypothetical protein
VTAADVDQLLRQAYEGEVLGEAFFGRLGELTDDADHKAKLAVLRRLEACTKVLIRPAIERRGIGVDDLVDQLLAHEAALAEFSRREVAGELDHSVDPILALPHVQ